MHIKGNLSIHLYMVRNYRRLSEVAVLVVSNMSQLATCQLYYSRKAAEYLFIICSESWRTYIVIGWFFPSRWLFLGMFQTAGVRSCNKKCVFVLCSPLSVTRSLSSVFRSLSALECICTAKLQIDSYQNLCTGLFGWQVVQAEIGISTFFRFLTWFRTFEK